MDRLPVQCWFRHRTKRTFIRMGCIYIHMHASIALSALNQLSRFRTHQAFATRPLLINFILTLLLSSSIRLSVSSAFVASALG
ncbi:hypothetical protein DFH11DRAFT_1009018 [Phellopilus nigrolimitatus]|nr:hypothetical protein DFH11DRAFT_1009018 [Phellopilus nigrolimitatus]